MRWSEGYERIAERAAELPATRHVCIGDSESDLLALMLKAREMGHAADYLVRCKHNRTLPAGGKLWEAVQQQAPLGRVRFALPAGRGRAARRVEQELRVRRVALGHGAGEPVEVTCLIAAEVNAPEGAKAIVWRLLSNREVSTLETAVELVDYYRCRWEIELFFLVLKEGCRVERLRLGDTERLQTALALYMVIAWRINRLMRLARTLPELPADLLFEPDEWQAAFILNKKPVPRQTPTLNAVVCSLPSVAASWPARATASPAPSPSGWACATSLPSSRACAMRGSRKRLVCNGMGSASSDFKVDKNSK